MVLFRRRVEEVSGMREESNEDCKRGVERFKDRRGMDKLANGSVELAREVRGNRSLNVEVNLAEGLSPSDLYASDATFAAGGLAKEAGGGYLSLSETREERILIGETFELENMPCRSLCNTDYISYLIFSGPNLAQEQ